MALTPSAPGSVPAPPPSSSGPGRRPFKAVTRVRISLGALVGSALRRHTRQSSGGASRGTGDDTGRSTTCRSPVDCPSVVGDETRAPLVDDPAATGYHGTHHPVSDEDGCQAGGADRLGPGRCGDSEVHGGRRRAVRRGGVGGEHAHRPIILLGAGRAVDPRRPPGRGSGGMPYSGTLPLRAVVEPRGPRARVDAAKAPRGPVVQLGVHAGLSSRRSRVQIPSGPLQAARFAGRLARSGSSVGRARA